MGKLGKKMAKNQKKNKDVQMQQEMNPLKKQMQQQMADGKFSEAITTMAELANLKCMDPEIMYDGAYCYFMLGDYERAANWINNTLTYEPNHSQARILLARLCILQDRTEDGLAIFEFVLENYLTSLSAASKEEIEEILEYYARNEADKLRRRYPHIAAFMHLEEAGQSAAAAAGEALAEPAEPLAKAQAAVAALKNLMAKNEAIDTRERPAEPSADVPEKAAAVTNKAQSAIASLKNLMAKTQTEVKENSEQASAAKLEQPIAAVEKIRLLRTKAGEAFVSNRLSEAQSLLQEAFELDPGDDATLRSLAIAAIAGGNRKQAIDYALRMETVDFLLLDRLRVH